MLTYCFIDLLLAISGAWTSLHSLNIGLTGLPFVAGLYWVQTYVCGDNMPMFCDIFARCQHLPINIPTRNVKHLACFTPPHVCIASCPKLLTSCRLNLSYSLGVCSLRSKTSFHQISWNLQRYGLSLSDWYKIWQVPRLLCCRYACQFSKRHDVTFYRRVGALAYWLLIDKIGVR